MSFLNMKSVFNTFIKIVKLIALILMIPFALIVSFFLPFKAGLSFFLFVLPFTILMFWIIKKILSNKSGQKAKNFSFYNIIAGCAIFLVIILVVFSLLNIKKISPEKFIRDIYQIESRNPIALFVDKGNKGDLLKDYFKQEVRRFLPASKIYNNLKVLNFRVSSYSLDAFLFLFKDIFINQQYFFETSLKIPFIIDCGSHIGMSILYFKSLYPNAEIMAFEPAPETFKYLQENVKNNKLENVILINKAVSNQEGKVRFYGDDSLVSSLSKQRGGENWVEVEVVKLSKYINHQVDFIKIDIEGAETSVLEDLAINNKLNLVKQMIIEYHHHIERNIDTLSRFLNILEENNFGYQIEGGSRWPFKKMEFEDMMIYAYQK